MTEFKDFMYFQGENNTGRQEVLEVFPDDPVFAGIETADLPTKFRAWVHRYLHVYQDKCSVVVVRLKLCNLFFLFFCMLIFNNCLLNIVSKFWGASGK